MEIWEDNNIFSGSKQENINSDSAVTDEVTAEEKINTEKQSGTDEQVVAKKQAPSPGTRIIYQAPEKGTKREYTGFTVENYASEGPVVSQDTEVNESKSETQKYTGGHDFEQELKAKNAYPRKRPAPAIHTEDAEIDEKELLRRRYLEYKKSGKAPKAEDVVLDEIDSLDVENISIDTNKAKKKLSTGEIVRRCVLTVSVIAIVISLGVLLNQYIQYKRNQELVNDLNQLIITEPVSTTKQDKNEEKEETTTRPLTIEEQWALLKEENPGVVFPAGIQLKYAKFYAINQDFVGYISIDELGVGLPVVQGNDEEYYMRRNIYKENSKYGCPFVPASNDMVNLDRNTVLYGHNMSDGSIFAPLNKYKTLSGYKSAPVVQFDTVYGTYKWKIFAAFITNASKEDDNGYVFPYNFTKLESDTDFMKYIELLKERSLYDTGVDVISTDKILTLSTCTYDFDNARFVVVARLVRDGESADVDTSQAKVNDNPHYPQAWYGKKKKDKKKNPYIDAEKWYYYG